MYNHTLQKRQLIHAYSDTPDFNTCIIFIFCLAGKMDTILAARYRDFVFRWIAGPLASKSLSETFEIWVNNYGGIAPTTPIAPDARVILDGDDDFRFRDIADTAYDMNYVICQTGKCTSHCIFICHNFYLPEIKYKSPCILI